jgi:phosphate acetyltransferase
MINNQQCRQESEKAAMSHNLYITASEAKSGKSAISLGIVELLYRKINKVGYFRPLIDINEGTEPNGRDSDLSLISSHFKMDIPYDAMYGLNMEEAQELFSKGKRDTIIEKILRKYNQLADQCDFVLCEGTDYATATSAFEFNLNATIALNLGSPVLLVATVATAYQKNLDDIINDTISSIEIASGSLAERGCTIIATIVNRIEPEIKEEMLSRLRKSDYTKDQLLYLIPEQKSLGNPTVREIVDFLGARAKVLYGEDQLNRHVSNFTVAAMQLQNYLPRIEPGTLVITPGDRADVIIASVAAVSSLSMDTISGIVLTGGLIPEEIIWKLIRGFPVSIPIVSVKDDTMPTAREIDKIHAKISSHDKLKITEALSLFEKNVNLMELGQKIVTTKTTIMTPKMFEYGLLQKARSEKKHIVLPEGEEERILHAAEILLARDVVEVTLLGNERLIKEKISQLGLDMRGVTIIEPVQSDLKDDYGTTYFELRKHKGITKDFAYDKMKDVNYFGTMMVYKGHAHGMVSGSVHSTADTIRPAFEFIKTKPNVSIVSSVFFMCLQDKVLVYGDCAINPDPNAQQLAEIALSSAQTAKNFGVEPRVAMLSYSTGASGQGADVEKVREATKIAKELAPKFFDDLKIEGPIQYDAAVDCAVAKTKMPESEVAGRATVFIFPDLNTGNNTYKAVQRSANAIAVGPVLQGLNYPVNDLSRGCTVADIVNTVAITAVQAQK